MYIKYNFMCSSKCERKRAFSWLISFSDLTQRRKRCYHSLRPGVFAFSLFWFTSAPDNNLVVIVIKPKCSWLIFGMFSSYLGFGGDAVLWNCRTTSLGKEIRELKGSAFIKS